MNCYNHAGEGEKTAFPQVLQYPSFHLSAINLTAAWRSAAGGDTLFVWSIEVSRWRGRVHSHLGTGATWLHSCQGQAQMAPGLSHAAAAAGLCFSIFANNLSKPGFIFACRFGAFPPQPSVPSSGTSALPAFMATFSQAASPVLLSPWTAFVGKTQRSMGPLPVLDELPVPPHSAELVLSPGCGCRGQGRGQT